jgi:hypothetical protein
VWLLSRPAGHPSREPGPVWLLSRPAGRPPQEAGLAWIGRFGMLRGAKWLWWSQH